MRLDKQLRVELRLLPKQAFFSNCWFNMVHELSLDSYRVRTMNPQNILRELLIMFEAHANDNDRTRVAQEAIQILTEEDVLGNQRFAPLVQDVIDLLEQVVGKKDGAKGGQNKPDRSAASKEKGSFGRTGTLIQAVVRELLYHLDDGFISQSLDWLKAAVSATEPGLLSPTKSCTEAQAFAGIERVTCNLLSSLLDRGWSLESLFLLHQRILVPPLAKNWAGDDNTYSFDEAFSKIQAKLTSPPKPFTVIFAILNVSKPESFPPKIANISFQVTPPDVSENSNEYAKKYAKRAGNKLFATVTVQAQDGRQAGMKASDMISHILDLVRFEYERKNISLQEQFLLLKDDEYNRYIRLTIPKVVPNPEAEWQPAELADFVDKLADLVAGGTLPDDARDRIYAAFRLYRVGADTRNFENKLVNWWTALEFLVKGAYVGGGIGESVETALIPPILLAYIPKHLDAFRSYMAHLEIEITAPVGQKPINFRKISLWEFYKLLLCDDMDIAIEAACVNHRFLWLKLKPFIVILRDTKKMAEHLQKHGEKLGWNIQRIYRARCDIVHSAQRRVNAALLCANLEFYLKTVLGALLDSLHTIPTLSDPKEFFERQNYILTKIGKELRADKRETFEIALARFG